MKPLSRPTLALALTVASAALLSAPPAAQGEIDPTPIASCPELIVAYVDPITGTDGGTSQLNDPTQPFRTIQFAIDYCQLGVIYAYNPVTNPNGRGLVVCMPGVYGPTGVQAGPTDTQTIKVRDRVSIQGSGARRTILRGGFPPTLVFWPDQVTCGTPGGTHQVLLEFSSQSDKVGNPIYGPLPWMNTGDSEEMVDAFTFEGGEVQVHYGGEFPGRGRVSNCVFDMRGSPFFGILIVHQYDPNAYPPNQGCEAGYWDTPFNVLNNTFVMGEMPPSGVTANQSLNQAVAICDVNNPICGPGGIAQDPAGSTLRGVGKLSIQNNLIRSLPSQTLVRELLGIDAGDTSVALVGGTNPGPTNSFHASRVGGSNGMFFSAIVGSPPVPRPSADLDTVTNDPPFVSEALTPTLTTFRNYRDWRLLPSSSSPMATNAQQDAGSSPLDDGTLTANSGVVYAEPTCPALSSFDWDGEVYGNPRIIGGEVDIGFDEVHGLIMSGTWANDTNNHNNPDPVIDPNGGTGATFRVMIFPEKLQGTTVNGASVSVNGTLMPYVFVPPIAAWLSQPGTVSPPVTNALLPRDYRDRYIVFNNPAPTPTPWAGVIGTRVLTNPVSLQHFRVGLLTQTDNEGIGLPCKYFNAQAVITLNNTKYRTNLQSEYR